MRKKYILILSITLTSILLIYINKERSNADKTMPEIKHPELGSTPAEAAQTIQPSLVEKVPDFQKNPIASTADLPDDLRKQIMHDIEQGGPVNAMSQNSAGFSEEGAKKITSGGAISINDMPKELQETMLEQLNEIKKNGFELVNDSEISKITDIENNIVDSSETIKKLSFKPSKIPETLTSDYNYVGYSFDNTSFNQSSDGLSDSVRRIYKSLDSTHIIVVEERSLANGSSNLISEFTNGNVGDSPSIYSTKKSDTGKSFSMLSWSGKNYSYSIYMSGNSNENTNEKLTKIGEELDKNNNK